MQKPPIPENEELRLAALARYEVIDTLPEELYDNITFLASEICGTPVALVSLVDEKRQWFKSRHGLQASETARELSFCGHAIHQDQVFEINNALEDSRFSDNPLVVGEPRVIFYAGVPLTTPDNLRIGTLCVIDHKPNVLTEKQRLSLHSLGKQVMALLELRLTAKTAIAALEKQKHLEDAKLYAFKLAEYERAKLVRVFEMTPHPVAILSGPQHVFTFTNSAYRNSLLGGKDVTGKRVQEVMPDVFDQGLTMVLDQVFYTGKPHSAKETSVDLLQADGSTRRFILNFSYDVIRDTAGRVEGILVSATDMTELVMSRDVEIQTRRLIETYANDISVQKAKLEALIAHSSSAIGLMRGEDLVFEVANKKWTELVTPRPYIGRAYADVYPELVGTEAHRSLLDIFRTGKSFVANEMKLLVTSPAGILEEQYFDYLNVRIHDAEGKPYGVYCNAINVTEKVRARLELEKAKLEAERANSTKSSFLANMSHEIRTPLGAIIGFTDLLREPEISTSEKDQYLDTISRSGKALTRIIDDILDLAKVESGKLELESLEINFKQLIHEVVDLFRELTRAKGVYLRPVFDQSVPERVVTDPTRLRQILLNIVGNAVKFTEVGGVEIEISVAKMIGAEAQFLIKVKDTGIGLPADQAQSLFQPFMQADNSTTRRFGGTGLGLALSKRLANALGGDISISRAEIGKGCDFLIEFVAELPAVKTGVTPTSKVAREVGIAARELEGINILLADDSDDNRMLAKLILNRRGATVETASNGLEAFRMAVEGNFDIVLMDIQMPVMDGYEATRALREGGFLRPIIALTAHAMAEERARSLVAGCNGHLTKPLDQKEIIAVIQRELRVFAGSMN